PPFRLASPLLGGMISGPGGGPRLPADALGRGPKRLKTATTKGMANAEPNLSFSHRHQFRLIGHIPCGRCGPGLFAPKHLQAAGGGTSPARGAAREVCRRRVVAG